MDNPKIHFAPLFKWIVRHAFAVVIVSLILGAVSIFYSTKLYRNLRTDIEELLPTNSRSVQDLEEVRSRLLSLDNLAILVFSDHPEASRRFVVDLASALAPVPKDKIASVEYSIAGELKFFKDRKSLLIEYADLVRILQYLRDRIDYERRIRNPLALFLGAKANMPAFDFKGLRDKYEGQTSLYDRFPNGMYATPDEKKRVVLVYKPAATKGFSGANELKKLVEQKINFLDPKKYAPDLKVIYTGGVQNTIEEQNALVKDLELSTVVVAVIVGISLLFFFRSVAVTICLLTGLFIGTFWTFGVSYFLVGYLNANSAFLGAIVLGNGINFPIILAARYLEERRNHFSHSDAIQLACVGSMKSTFTAALAAGLAYGSLAWTGFRGFRQFGVIGLAGMVLCWLSAYIVFPAFLTVYDHFFPIHVKPKHRAWLTPVVSHIVQKNPKSVLFVSFVATVLSVIYCSRADKHILETDLTKLRNKVSMRSGSGFYSRYVDEIFGRYLSPLVAMPRNPANTKVLVAALKQKKAEQGPTSLIKNVQSLADFIPEYQSQKIKIFNTIRNSLSPKVMGALENNERVLVNTLLDSHSMLPFTANDLPDLIKNKFRERDGSMGKLVLIEPPLGSATLDGDKLTEFIADVRATIDRVEKGAPLAGPIAISADMISSIIRDGPKATLIAFFAVSLLVVFLFNSFHSWLPVVGALVVGVLWLFGLIFAFHLKINFLNFIALPITFGIGVDYAANIFGRYEKEGPESLVKVLEETGPAVFLCSWTTIVGYGSLIIAENQAFVSFGWLAIFGELTCLAAALFTLPAFLLYASKKS